MKFIIYNNASKQKDKVYFSKPGISLLLLMVLFFVTGIAWGQRPPIPPPCDGPGTMPGSLPNTAIPICDKGTYYQPHPFRCVGGAVKVPNHCRFNPLFPPEDMSYDIFAPVYYRFKCYASGTLGFMIAPVSLHVNLDWQLYDITGIRPDQAIRSTEKLIAGNWSTGTDRTGTEERGIPFFICKPFPPNLSYPPYSAMPELISGHEYLLLIANPRLNHDDYNLIIDGGTADIRDPVKPHLDKATASCNGKEITLRLNKEIKCSSLTATGSEFNILPAGPSIVSAKAINCNTNAEFTELTLSLSSVLTGSNYQLVINNGSDNNTLLDFCNTPIPANEKIVFDFETPLPLRADSIAKPECMPDFVKLYFPKRITCSGISANGSEFSVSGPVPVTVKSASGKCTDGKTEYINIKFESPLKTKGIYTLTIKDGDDGDIIVDECDQEIPEQTINFTVSDTVEADFTYTIKMGCRQDTLYFSHPGTHDVNNWAWKFNEKIIHTQNPVITCPAKSNNQAELIVSNGTCKDSTSVKIELDNEVISLFDMPSVLCPEDKFEVENNTIGRADKWRWNFDVISSSTEKDPPPFLLPQPNRESYYTIKLVAHSTIFGCSDSSWKTLTVLDNCLIAVPNAFTPNNDGVNDYFWPHNALKADNYEFKVFNRWGQVVFQTRNWQTKWDGKINGDVQVTGVYVWMLSYTHRDTKQPVFRKGTVTLIR